MRSQRPQIVRGLIGAACVAAFAFQAFTFSVDAEPSPEAVPSVVAKPTLMPTARDLTIFDRKLRKASRESRFAKSCGQGQLLGGTEVVVAMQFPSHHTPSTADAPGFAQAHVERNTTTRKALVVESVEPTLWKVTGAPSAIILLGEAVIADYPEGTPVFAPRFADSCDDATWINTPPNWTFPQRQAAMSALVDDVHARFDKRAQTIAEQMFGRRASNWRVERGDVLMKF